uniref:Protein kinase domain-containing protein n=1 Tax=Arcella intermedia TaxID=1963864 RepID=A0A6B2KYU1_9EUKA
MTGDSARAIFTTSGLSIQDLAIIWNLADTDKDSCLNLVEYVIARFLIFARQQNQPLPQALPSSLKESLNPSLSLPSSPVSPPTAPLFSPSAPYNNIWAVILEGSKKKRPTSSKKNQDKSASANSQKQRPGALKQGRDKKADTMPLPGESAWVIPKTNFNLYSAIFGQHNEGGYITGAKAFELFSSSQIDRKTLAQVWTLANINGQSSLDAVEFKIAMHLIHNILLGIELPATLPHELLESAKIPKIFRSTSTPALNLDVVPNNTPTQPVPSSPDPFAPPLSFVPSNNANFIRASGGLPSNNSSSSVGPPWFNSPSTGQFIPSQQLQPIPQQQPLQLQPIPQQQLQAIQQPLLQPLQMQPMASSVTPIDPSSVQRANVIGAGSFAKVWKGTWNGEVVAIKDLSYRSEQEVEMWKKEVQLLLKLQHANYLVKIKGYCVSTNYLTIVMEFMDGGSLFDIIHSKTKKVTWNMLHKVRIMRHIAKAIESVHQENIIHRDIKSMNILLDRNGIAKLTDLGCSRLVRTETMTKGVGSPLWMSPEVAKGQSYSFPCDIFSFGVVCFEIFNETLPEYDMATQQVVIPQDCLGSAIIKECIRINPDRRPTATKLIGSLDMFITTFTTAAARVVLSKHNGNISELPKLEDVTAWYNIFLGFDRERFDALLNSGFSILKN